MIDWLAASVAQRQALYRAVKRLLDEEGLSWGDLYRDTLGQDYPPGHGYEDNFRAGRIARKKAHAIYNWLDERYPARAKALEAALADEDERQHTGEHWRRFLSEHGRYARVRAVLLRDADLGIVSFARGEPLAGPVIPFGASFGFEIDSPIAGMALALQAVGGAWYALPLREDALTDVVLPGVQMLPRQLGSDTPYPLSEEAHDGRHGFVFLIGQAEVIAPLVSIVPVGRPMAPAELDQIADQFLAAETEWHMLRINLMFRA
ncbi:hypothetical protein [Stakelama tenebrarum]|uniref:Uncharacterized protein n=1 Tax=Stakelama tenebrarum TaxID=2711215 RepID=A0A6G6Y493_9SPHN|nr:hypothetical protein [Sphingosinithalassobacter tenebrarum]QIG79627.1 hypothetical protein G5C33_07375 [Sphingosinithalassobacter tenebrarum]